MFDKMFHVMLYISIDFLTKIKIKLISLKDIIKIKKPDDIVF